MCPPRSPFPIPPFPRPPRPPHPFQSRSRSLLRCHAYLPVYLLALYLYTPTGPRRLISVADTFHPRVLCFPRSPASASHPPLSPPPPLGFAASFPLVPPIFHPAPSVSRSPRISPDVRRHARRPSLYDFSLYEHRFINRTCLDQTLPVHQEPSAEAGENRAEARKEARRLGAIANTSLGGNA